jgi:hypothetical protein
MESHKSHVPNHQPVVDVLDMAISVADQLEGPKIHPASGWPSGAALERTLL